MNARKSTLFFVFVVFGLSMFLGIMAQTVDLCPQIEVMLGEPLYSNRKICSIADEYGIKPYFLPKTNATFRAKGVAS